MKGKVVGKTIITSLEEEKKKGDIILSADKFGNKGLLKNVQVVHLTGHLCEVVKPKDKVQINFDRYYVKSQDEQFGRYKNKLVVPTIEIDGVTYGKFSENDIEYIY